MKSASQSNLHQIGLAILMYAQDHGGRYPDTLGEVWRASRSRPQAFVCPASPDEAAAARPRGPSPPAVDAAGGHCSYVYVGRGLTDEDRDRRDGGRYEPLANHGDGGNVLYGDGHADWADAARDAVAAATRQADDP